MKTAVHHHIWNKIEEAIWRQVVATLNHTVRDTTQHFIEYQTPVNIGESVNVNFRNLIVNQIKDTHQP